MKWNKWNNNVIMKIIIIEIIINVKCKIMK